MLITFLVWPLDGMHFEIVLGWRAEIPKMYDTETNDGNLVLLHFLTHNHQLQMLVVLGWVCYNWDHFSLSNWKKNCDCVFNLRHIWSSTIWLKQNFIFTFNFNFAKTPPLPSQRMEGNYKYLKRRSHWQQFELECRRVIVPHPYLDHKVISASKPF